MFESGGKLRLCDRVATNIWSVVQSLTCESYRHISDVSFQNEVRGKPNSSKSESPHIECDLTALKFCTA